MQDAGHAVGGLHGESDLPIKGIKRHPVIDEVGDTSRGFVSQDMYRFLIRQAITGFHGILRMKLRGIVLTDSGGNTPLGIFGVAVINTALGDNQHAALLLGQQGSIESTDTAAHHDVIILVHLHSFRIRYIRLNLHPF